MSAPRLGDAAAAAALRAGSVLLLATDTVCGLHARADFPAALARIADLKGRPQGKPLLVLAESLAQARSLCRPLSVAQAALCAAAWPGPFTFLLPARAGLEPALVDPQPGTVAVRVPGREDLRRLIGLAGGPLASTSANPSGEPPLTILADAVAAFGHGLAGWWEGDPGYDQGVGQPSALVDLTGDSPRILRAGPLPLPPPGPAVS
ncbi:MAG: L-threonylcarbamoyladenylate synthase [bacterium]|nr:L-threonylcarbamoyladenylate synthase [bacterium]